MSFIARYVYLYDGFVFVTEDTAVQQNDSDRTKTDNKKNTQTRNNNIQMYNCMYRYITMDSFVCTGIVCVIEV